MLGAIDTRFGFQTVFSISRAYLIILLAKMEHRCGYCDAHWFIFDFEQNIRILTDQFVLTTKVMLEFRNIKEQQKTTVHVRTCF